MPLAASESARTIAAARLLVATGLALSLGALPPAAAIADASPNEASATAEAEGKAQDVTLFIGHHDSLSQVACKAEATPEGLIAALAEETGWNLGLAGTPSVDQKTGLVTVAFAEDSAVYTEPPEPQNDAYHVFDKRDLVYTVLNSVATTLYQNTAYAGVCFSGPDGGPLVLDMDGGEFFLSRHCVWDEELVEATNSPLPEDSIGVVQLSPNGYDVAGSRTLTLSFMRDTVEAGAGCVTVADSAGNVVDIVDIADCERVTRAAMNGDELAAHNYASGCMFTIALDEPLAPGTSYTVTVDAGAFTSGAIASKAIAGSTWAFETSSYGTGPSTLPLGSDPMVVGTSYTEEYLLGDIVAGVTIEADDAGAAEFSATELAGDGTLTITPLKEGTLSYRAVFELVDGGRTSLHYTFDVVRN